MGSNWYLYCDNEPLTRSDPRGTAWLLNGSTLDGYDPYKDPILARYARPDWALSYHSEWGGWPSTYDYRTADRSVKTHWADEGDFIPSDHILNAGSYKPSDFKYAIVAGVYRRPKYQLIREYEEFHGEPLPRNADGS